MKNKTTVITFIDFKNGADRKGSIFQNSMKKKCVKRLDKILEGTGFKAKIIAFPKDITPTKEKLCSMGHIFITDVKVKYCLEKIEKTISKSRK